MLTTGKEILDRASAENYGVGAFNFVNFEMLNAIFEAAVEKNSPILVQASEGAIKYLGIDMVVSMVRTMSARHPKIPVALHLDHGTTFESCKKAIDSGFTSVMIDASHHNFNENLALSKQVIDYAHRHGVSVEAELGRLMGIEDNIVVDEKDSALINVDEAEIFVQKTGVDYLAPAIGTSHGAFKFKGEAKLDFDRLREVKKRTKIPLVLHGASVIPEWVKDAFLATGGELKSAKGLPVAMLQESIKNGINKINIDTDLRIAFSAELRRIVQEDPKEFDLRKFLRPAMDSVKKLIGERMEILGSAGKI